MRRAAEKLRRGVFAVTQVEGCLEFICRNDAALCFPHWGCRYRSVMPPWRDADTFGTQLFATDALHVSEKVTVRVGHAHFDQIVGLL